MCRNAIMIHWQRRVTLGFLILLAGVKAWSPVKGSSLNSYFRSSWNGLFPPSNTCSHKVIPLGMTTRFVFIELPAIAAFIVGVKYISRTSKTIIPCFLRAPLDFCSTPVSTNSSQVHWLSNLWVGIWQWFLSAVAPQSMFCRSESRKVAPRYHLLDRQPDVTHLL